MDSMPEARSTEEVREMDRRTIEEFGLPGVALMENAGRAAADVAAALGPSKVAILAGSGNNGGDGCVVARHLANRGIGVEVFLFADRAKIGGDAAVNLAVIEKMGVPVTDATASDDLVARLRDFDLLVDGLLGTGVKGEVREPYLGAIKSANASGVPILALDVPSGLDGDTGEVLGEAIKAEITVTFGAPKLGLERGEGPARSGRVAVADIGMPRAVYET